MSLVDVVVGAAQVTVREAPGADGQAPRVVPDLRDAVVAVLRALDLPRAAAAIATAFDAVAPVAGSPPADAPAEVSEEECARRWAAAERLVLAADLLPDDDGHHADLVDRVLDDHEYATRVRTSALGHGLSADIAEDWMDIITGRDTPPTG